MKKIIITMLIASALISMYGCQSVSGDTNETENEAVQNNVTTTAPQSTDVTTTGTTKPTEPDTVRVTDFQYKVNNEGGITITKYKGKDKDVIIPEKIAGKNVTVIGRDAFRNNENIDSVTMPDTVTDIEEYAFTECSVKTVVLSQNLQYIGASAFEDTELTEVTVPGSVKVIDICAFSTSELKSVTLNEGIEKIALYAFWGTRISEITIPASVKNVSELSFIYCYNLDKIVFEGDAPDYFIDEYTSNYTHSKNCTVYYHENAKGFTSPVWNGFYSQIIGKESEIRSYNGFDYYENSDGTVTIHRYNGGDKADVVIPDMIDGKKVTAIGMYAFSQKYGVWSVVIPDTVTVIETKAFIDCYSLTEVTMSKKLETLGNNAFYGCSHLSEVTLPDTLVYLGDGAFYECTSLRHIRIPGSVTYFGSFVFYKSGLETVELEEGLRVIGLGAFSTTKLKEVVLPSSMGKIEEFAFDECTLESVILNEGLVTIGDYAFWHTTIKEIVIPSTVKEITELAFDECSELKNVKFEGDAPENYIDKDERAINVSYTVCYHEGAKGFTSSKWNGYETEIW